MNRYTNLTPASFDPLSLQEIMMVPLARQKQHMDQQIALENLGVYDVNRLKVDDDAVREGISGLKSTQTAIEDELFEKGASSSLAKKLMNLKRERDSFLSNDGIGGKAQNQYNAYLANRDYLQKLYTSGKISSDKYQLGLQKALSDYKNTGGVAKDGSYSGFNAVADTDYMKIATDEANWLAQNPQQEEILRYNGYRSLGNGMYESIKDGREVTTKEAIQGAVINRLYNDSSIRQDLQQRADLGLFGKGRTMEDEIYDLANNLGITRQVYNTTVDQKLGNLPKDGSLNLDSRQSPSYNYVLPPITNQKATRDSYSSVVDNILAGNSKPDEKTVSTEGNPLTGYSTRTVSKKEEKWSVSDLPEEVQERYKEYAEGLKQKGIIDNTDLNDTDTLEKINAYDKRFYKDINRVGVISDVTGNIGKYSTGIDTSDYNKMLKAVKNTAHRATYKHPETGETYTWKELQEKLGVKEVKDIEGYVDVDNNLPSTEGSKSDIKSEWVSPEVVSLMTQDGNTLHGFYKTRDDSAQNSPRYIVDVELNKNIFSKVKMKPMLPQKTEYLGREVEMTYYPENEALNMLNNHAALKEDRSEEAVLEYNQILQTIQNAGNRQGIYEIRNSQGDVMYVTKENLQANAYRHREIKY